MSKELSLKQVSDILWYFYLCFNYCSLFCFYFRKIVDVGLCQFLLPSLKVECDLLHIELALTSTHSNLSWPCCSSNTQSGGVSHCEQNSCYLSWWKGTQALEFTDPYRIANFESPRGERHCRRNISVNGRWKKLNLGNPCHFIRFGSKMKSRWIFDLVF